MICGSTGCNQSSLQSQIKQWSKFSNTTFIANPAQSWIDDFFDWSKDCCLQKVEEFCPTDVSQINDDDYGDFDEETDKMLNEFCQFCPGRGHQRPNPGQFKDSIRWFLLDNPSENCPKAGHAAYETSLKLNDKTDVIASNFFTFHTVLKSSSDYIMALKWSRALADNITRFIRADSSLKDVNVFPYSIFYVFYEQYLNILSDTLVSISISLGAIFINTYLLSSFNIHSAIITTVIVLCVVIDLAGMMFWWNISLNAISLVNLVMSVGVSVEFVCHMMRHFFNLQENMVQSVAAKKALLAQGNILISGIVTTHLVGVVILAFANSRIFTVFYFRMYLGVIIIAGLHAVILLPVLLSFWNFGR